MDQSPELYSANPRFNENLVNASNLQEALDNREFVPYFQPQIDLRSGTLHGFEILARWQHPTCGLIPPGAFIPLVERSGLINRLSASLLTQAFSVARCLPNNLRLSVNLSPSQLHDRSLPDFIHRMADEAEFDLTRLTVELTETALVDDLALAGLVAANFKRLGIRLALDDFGTGYSSLLHLQSLPFDELKLDISFVRSMVHSRQSRKITAAVISLGLSLGMQTVAEGIEEQDQVNLLTWQGCDLGQGYLYGRPIPATEILDSLSKRHHVVCAASEVPVSIADPFLSLDAHPTERLSQLRAIYDSAPVGLAFVDCELRYVNLNQQLARMNRQSVQAHLGQKVSDMVSAEIYERFEPHLKRAIAGESVDPFELKTFPTGPSGLARTLLISYQPVRDEMGEILGVCVSISDISVVKQKEEALLESEDHYRHTVDLNPQALWTMEPDGTITISSQWEALTGLTQEQTSHGGWLSAVHKDDLDRISKEFEISLKTGTPMDLQLRIRNKYGVWVWMRSHGAPRRNSAGDIIRWYGSVESIDEYKRAIDQLEASKAIIRCSEARLHAIFDYAPVGIVMVDSSTGRVLNANPRAEQIIGFHFRPDMDWIAEGWKTVDSTGWPIDGLDVPVMRAMRVGESTDAKEVILRRPNGTRIGLEFTAAPIFLQDRDRPARILFVRRIDTRGRERKHVAKLSQELPGISSPGAYRPRRNTA